MANFFTPYPGNLESGATWPGKYNAQLQRSEGLLTTKIFNNAGVPTLKAGLIGINDGVNRGVISIDQTALSLAGLASAWYLVEVAIHVNLYDVIISLTAVADPPSGYDLPTSFKNSFIGIKGGFYVNSNKRCIGLVNVKSGSALACIINTIPFIDGWVGQRDQIFAGAGYNGHSYLKLGDDNSKIEGFGLFYNPTTQLIEIGAEKRVSMTPAMSRVDTAFIYNCVYSSEWTAGNEFFIKYPFAGYWRGYHANCYLAQYQNGGFQNIASGNTTAYNLILFPGRYKMRGGVDGDPDYASYLYASSVLFMREPLSDSTQANIKSNIDINTYP